MCRARLSRFLQEDTQQIHSLRASGVLCRQAASLGSREEGLSQICRQPVDDTVGNGLSAHGFEHRTKVIEGA
jgi:hypothetical protein